MMSSGNAKGIIKSVPALLWADLLRTPAPASTLAGVFLWPSKSSGWFLDSLETGKPRLGFLGSGIRHWRPQRQKRIVSRLLIQVFRLRSSKQLARLTLLLHQKQRKRWPGSCPFSP